MSGKQQQTQNTLAGKSEADAIISQLAKQARVAQTVLAGQKQTTAMRPFFRLLS